MKSVTLEEAIERLREQLKPYPMQPRCPEPELAALPEAVERELHVPLPTRYLDVLRIVNL